MKKITFLLTFLLTAVVGMWAQPAGTTLMTGETLETGYYYIYNNGKGSYLSANGSSYQWLDANSLTGEAGLWYITNRGAGTDGNIKYYIKYAGSNYYFGGLGPNAALNTTAADQRISVRESGAYYTLSGHANNTVGITNYNAIQWNSGTTLNRSGGGITSTTFGANSQWVIYKVVNATYTVSVVGTTDSNAGVQFGGNSYANGATFSASTDITAADFTANAVDGYVASVTINGTTVVVNYLEEKYAVDLTDLYVTNLSVATTTDPIVEGKWYMLTQVRGGESPAYDVGAGSTMKRAAASVTANSLLVTNTPANDIKQYLIRFFSTGEGNGYYIQYGTGNLWNNMTTTADLASATAFLVYNATQEADQSTGWAINKTTDGTTYGDKVDNNGATNTLSFWETGQTISGGNNVWKLYPVELGAFISNVSNITINVLKGSDIVKTVTMEDVAEGREINVAEALGNVAFVSSYNPATITAGATDQTVNVTYTSTLPFSISDDPESPDATAYLMTLRTTYAHGNVSSASTYDLSDQTYYWTFGGNEWDGITVYNRGNGYMSVGSAADNSVATFSSTPTAFTIKPNTNEPNGFNLNIPGTNAYINRRDNKVSTWLSANANNEVGSCLVVYTVNEAVSNLITSDIDPYFDYAGCVNALQVTDASNLAEEYSALKAAPNYNDYLTFKAKVEGYQMVEATEGYYLILSGLDAFRTKQSVDKAMLYNTSSKNVAWGNADASAAQIMKLKAVEGTTTFRLYVPLAGTYLQTKAGVTTENEASGIAFEVVAKKPSKVALVYNANGGTDAALHTAGHDNGAGDSGSLTGWTTDGDASMWRLIPVEIEEITLISPEGVADGDEVMQGFANATDAQLPLNVGVFTITEDLGAGARLDTIATSQIAAGQGYIISGVKGATVPLLPVNGTVDVPAGNLLVAGDGSLVSGGYILAYKKGEAEAKFWSINGLSVPANRSYLPEGAPTRGLENIFGGIGEDVTGINGITTGAENGAIYDLQGRRVNNAQKGVYIINGKKVIK